MKKLILLTLAPAILLSATLLADNGTPSSPYTEGFNVKWSYYHHTLGDDLALENKSILDTNPPDSDMYIQVTGSGKMVSHLQPGDYLHIQATGKVKFDGGSATPYVAAGVFTDRPAIKKRTGWQNRFQSTATQLPVQSRNNSPFKGKSGTWPGEGDVAAQSDAVQDFRIGRSNGYGIIVKIPTPPDPAYPKVYLFKSVNHTNFSGLVGSSAKLTLTEVDATTRPRYTISDNLSYSESSGSVQIPVLRTNRNEFSTKFKYSIAHGSTSEEDFLSTPVIASGLIDFPIGDAEVLLPAIHLKPENLYEGTETLNVTITVDPNDNPNEAYVQNDGSNSFTFPVSITESNPTPPKVSFELPIHEHTEPASDTDVNLAIKLDRPSAFNTTVLLSQNSGTSSATAGADFDWSGPQTVTIPSGETRVTETVTLKHDELFEPVEEIHFALSTPASPEAPTPPTLGTYPSSRINIINNSTTGPAPTATLTVTGPLDGEIPQLELPETGAVWQLEVLLSSRSSAATSIPLNYSGIATPDVDFTAPTPIVVPAGTLSAAFDITVTADSLQEFSESINIQISPPVTHGVNGSVGSPAVASLLILDDDGGSETDTIAPDPKPTANASLKMDVTAPLPGGTPIALWKIVGEPAWRMSGEVATGLASGFHEIEFRPLDGFSPPSRMIVQVFDNQEWTIPANEQPAYQNIDATTAGSMTVALYPPDLASESDPALRAQWKLEGESTWRDSGTTVPGLPTGYHKVIFKPLTDYQFVKPVYRKVLSPPTPNEFSAIYQTIVSGGGSIEQPAPLDNSTSDELPYALCGRITSSVGYASGTAVRERVVLTAAHALFDDRTLSYATDVHWNHQVQKDHYQPAAEDETELTGEVNPLGMTVHKSGIIPRGWVILSGYAERREQELGDPYAPGGIGVSTPESQNLDVAAAFFGKSVARGGRMGILTVTATELPGHWIQANVDKLLVGYAHDEATDDALGKIHATTPALHDFFPVYEHVFQSTTLAGGGGISGGPLLIRDSESEPWRMAGICLAKSSYGIFRELDTAVSDMIQLASNNSGDNNVTSHAMLTSGATSSASAFSSLTVQINNSAGRWAIWGTSQWKESGTTLDIAAGEYRVKFSSLNGWSKPSTMDVTVQSGRNNAYTANYMAQDYDTVKISLQSSSPPGTAVSLFDANADLDGDGITNFLEWAFNLDPSKSDRKTLAATTGTSGLPLVTLREIAGSKALMVEYIRFSEPSLLTYTVEFSNDCSSGSWQAGGQILSLAFVDEDWERVVVIDDATESSPKRFVRIRVEETPTP